MSKVQDRAVLKNVVQAVGGTPLVRLNRLTEGLKAQVLVKLESMNPLGSVKDRIGAAMLADAEEKGLISPGKSVLIEPTSGNTGIALAFVAAARGYKLVLTMPETMSAERRKVLSALGAQLVLTPGADGMRGAVARAQQLAEETPDSHVLHQFNNPANPAVHFSTTGPEIWDATSGDVDIFVSAVGTGGTISGVGKYLKSKNSKVEVIAVEPVDSPVISQTLKGEPIKPGPHKIQGIGAGFIPGILALDVIDKVITVTNDEAFVVARRLPREEGIFAGISTGANIHVALELAKLPENNGKTIVTVACSTGERYLSTPLFDIPVQS
jgi:cysteine synthase